MIKRIAAALPSLARLCLVAGLALGPLAAPASAALMQSWNGYKWARTGPLGLKTGLNVSAAWLPFVNTAISQWNVDPNIDFVPEAGRSTSACGAVYGTVQICSASYGFNGWLGYAYVWTSGGFIVQATVKLNDSYLMSGGKFSTDAWRSMTACQEIGHVLGLQHANAIKRDANKGTCMDYTNDPTGTAGGANGTLANIAPSATDYAALLNNYGTLDRTQLSFTRIELKAGSGFNVGEDDHHPHFLQAVPEPDSWAMIILGFGIIGGSARRQRGVVAA